MKSLNKVNNYLSNKAIEVKDGMLEDVAELPEYNGTVIYHSNPVLQFNAYTNTTKQLEKDTTLRGSAQFAQAAKISDGDSLEISFGKRIINRKFKLLHLILMNVINDLIIVQSLNL